MPHIPLPEGLPGIRGPMAFRPETAAPLNQLADVLLRGPSTLTRGQRELIATFVSARNDCRYCQTIHGAIAAHHLGGDEALVTKVKSQPEEAAVSPKLKALLVIAARVQEGGKQVGAADIARHQQYFYNSQHLNAQGAELFSTLVAHDIAEAMRPTVAAANAAP